MVTLHDPSKPAHEIITVNDDGSALRNDGKTLGAANDNVYYRLATVAGEATTQHLIEDGVATQNRRYWNGWACAGEWSEGKPSPRLEAIAAKIEIDIENLKPLNAAEKKAVLKRLDGMALPDPSEIVSMSGIYFSTSFSFQKHIVFSGISFIKAQFGGDAYFSAAQFEERAFFSAAQFGRDAYFNAAQFGGYASFSDAQFGGDAEFSDAQFRGGAEFSDAQFSGATYFSSTTFKARTDFTNTTFQTHVPEFHAAELYDHTLFSVGEGDGKYWPPEKGEVLIEGQDPIKVMPANEQKKAYNRLRLFMNETLQVDDEMFFHRREMACKKQIEKSPMPLIYGLYEVLSDYGYSITRPIFWLLVNVIVGGGVFGFYPKLDKTGSLIETMMTGFGVSFSNVFAFLGFGRLYRPDFYEQLGGIWAVLAGTQTILGVIFLFLFGLGMRSRFRLR